MQHEVGHLDRGFQNLVTRVDGLAASGLASGVSGRGTSTVGGGLPAAVKLEKPKPYSGNTDDPAVLNAFLYACELYFELTRVISPEQQATLALLWLEGDAAIWW